mmetsp:Transcript_20702/g.55395  ORF Transcript_20702/g.55395 Transcript_20702/m.55395 type:complete len:1436 (+) Transcript_20702:63-4370(+)
MPGQQPGMRVEGHRSAAPGAAAVAGVGALQARCRGDAGGISQGAPRLPTQAGSERAKFLAETILRKCSSMEAAKKYFAWLREEARAERAVRGRKITAEDVEQAVRLCRAVWAKRDQAKAREQEQNNSQVIYDHVVRKCGGMRDAHDFFLKLEAVGQKSKLGSLFTKEEVADARRKCSKFFSEPCPKAPRKHSGVDVIVKYILQRFPGMSNTSKFFYMLHRAAGESNQLSLLFSATDVSEARVQCTALFEEQASRGSSKTRARGAKVDAVSNVDIIVRHALRQWSSMGEAEAFFEELHGSVGRPCVALERRVFTADEVTEAWLRCQVCFDEQNNEADAQDSDSDAGGPSKRTLKRTMSQKQRSRKDSVDEDLDDELGPDDLSGEEAVDEEVGYVDPMDLGLNEKEIAELAKQDGYPAHAWQDGREEVTPGVVGFNDRAARAIRSAGVGKSVKDPSDGIVTCPPLQPHQETVGFLLHPRSPVQRLLVDHPTGSGKTREMIRVLDNYFYDPRPKVPIFPRDAVCRNFYRELLRWPSRYRDYFSCERPADAAIASGVPDWRERRSHMWDLGGLREAEVKRLCFCLREVLEMKGMSYMGMMRRSFRASFRRRHPGEHMPVAPLRALGYTSAGGSFSAIASGQPVSALMKIGFLAGSGNVYSNKVVLLDEAHNLVRTQTQYAEQLNHLRDLLVSAQGIVLAGFTGTPILNHPSDGRLLLDVIKGKEALGNDEGFLSAFPVRPRQLFALALPRGLPDGALTVQRRQQLVKKVELGGEALRMYDVKRQLGLTGQRLRNYCNVCCYVTSFHDGKFGSKARIMAAPEDCCPKLFAAVTAVVACPEKTVILASRTSGYAVVLDLLRQAAASSQPPFAVATMDELAQFNHISNIRGEAYRVLVADTNQCSEGVSFLTVRRILLLDVPSSYSQFVQQCGRAIRMYGHRALPAEEQVVSHQLYIAVFPPWLRSPLACWALRAQKRTASGQEMGRRARLLTARFRRAGLGTLSELKDRLDAHGDVATDLQQGSQGKCTMSAEGLIAFLEYYGLWEEAKLLYSAAKREKDSARSTVAQQKSQDDLLQQKPRTLAYALQALHLAATSEEALLTLSPKTADEHALDELAQNAQELAPVLKAMRAGAVDRAMLEGLEDTADGAQSEEDVAAGSPDESAGEVEDDPNREVDNINSLSSCDAPESRISARGAPNQQISARPATASTGDSISREGGASLSLPKALASQRCARPGKQDGGQTEPAATAAAAASLVRRNWRGEPESDSLPLCASQESSIDFASQDTLRLTQEEGDEHDEPESGLLGNIGSASCGPAIPSDLGAPDDTGLVSTHVAASLEENVAAAIVEAVDHDASSTGSAPPLNFDVEPLRPMKRMRLLGKTKDPFKTSAQHHSADSAACRTSCEVAPADAEPQHAGKQVRRRVRVKAPSTSWHARAGA